MPYFKDQGQAAAPSRTPVPTSKQGPATTKTNPFANFQVGNWSSDIWDEALWEEDDDMDSSNEQSTSSSISTSGPSTPPSSSSNSDSEAGSDSDSDTTDNWQDLDHKESLIDRLEGLALNYSAEDEDDHTTTPTPEPSDSGDESDSDSDNVIIRAAEQVFSAQRTLVSRALYPPKRDSLEPRRKHITLSTSPLHLPAPKFQCPKCHSTVFRPVLDHCVVCALHKAKNQLYDIEYQHMLEDEEDQRREAAIRERKGAIEAMDPEKYADDMEWLDLRTEQVDMKEERIERKAGFEVRVAELENEIEQYDKWMNEDLERVR